MFNRLIAHNDQIPLTPTSLTRFHSRAPPGISVSDYLLRISRYTNVEPCCLLLLLHYIDRICARLTSFTVSSLTVHRFAIAGVAVGSKALSDSFCTNARYARVGGVTLAEMNLLEREFCIAIDYRLTVRFPAYLETFLFLTSRLFPDDGSFARPVLHPTRWVAYGLPFGPDIGATYIGAVTCPAFPVVSRGARTYCGTTAAFSPSPGVPLLSTATAISRTVEVSVSTPPTSRRLRPDGRRPFHGGHDLAQP